MASKNGGAIAENDRRLIKDHALYVREALFSCVTQTQVECSVAFARYMSLVGLNSENYWLFLRLVMTNNPWVIDEMLHDREPRLLFSTIRPDAELIEAAFRTLFSRHPEELYPRALEALLGIIQSAYFDADDGYRIRRLSIMDINALGKFLLKDEPQEHPQNRLILEILDRITRLGEYYGEPDKSVLSKHAFNVRFAYFDRTREMVDAIPEPLLVRVPDRNGVSPEEDFADLVTKRRERKRDKSGRFVKEYPGAATNPEATERMHAQATPSDTEGKDRPDSKRQDSTSTKPERAGEGRSAIGPGVPKPSRSPAESAKRQGPAVRSPRKQVPTETKTGKNKPATGRSKKR